MTRRSSGRTDGVVRHGNDQNNVLLGGPGNDFFRGHEGDDHAIGRGGLDIYAFDIGEGHDIIEDNDGAGVLMFLAAIDLDAIVARREGGALVVRYGPRETVTLVNAREEAWRLESSCGGDALPLSVIVERGTP